MLIFADQNIPAIAQAFADIATVKLFDGRRVSANELQNADVLLVRSITKVNQQLLENSAVQFVGTATSGVDHIDRAFLAQRNIRFADAHGANAQAVAEYVVAVLLELAERYRETLQDKTLGVIGYGCVGKCLAEIAPHLGLSVLINDPPLQKIGSHPDTQFLELADVLQQADIVSLHVPLNKEGPYPTANMVNQNFLDSLKPGCWLINTARGNVIDDQALLGYLNRGGIAALDVWRDEPRITEAVLEASSLATPHVAGYSQDAKLKATAMLHRAVCTAFELNGSWTPQLPQPNPIQILAPTLAQVVKQTYQVTKDDASLRTLLQLPQNQRASYFDSLRINYAFRREFAAWQSAPAVDANERIILQSLGFREISEN